jgi:uncharacterized membrane protein YraQ (UPF0718 family)
MMKLLNRYKAFIVLLIINIGLLVFAPVIGNKSFEITWKSVLEMMSILPAIFILLGLLDVWVDRATMMKYTGKDSGLKGVLISFVLGSAAAGPLYAAFPIATIMMKKGSSLFNIFIFIGAWSTTKIPMLTFEAANLGVQYTALRLALSIVGIVLIAGVLSRALTKEDQEEMIQLGDKKD